MHGNADGARLVRKRPRNRLPYPPGRIRGKFESFAVIKFLHCARKPDIPLLDEVQNAQVRRAVRVPLRDGNDEAQVRLHQFLARFLVARLGALREFPFFLFCEKRRFPDAPQIHLHRVRRSPVRRKRFLYFRLGRLFLFRNVNKPACFYDFDVRFFQPVVNLFQECQVLLDFREIIKKFVVGHETARTSALNELFQCRVVNYRLFLACGRFLLARLDSPTRQAYLPSFRMPLSPFFTLSSSKGLFSPDFFLPLSSVTPFSPLTPLRGTLHAPRFFGGSFLRPFFANHALFLFCFFLLHRVTKLRIGTNIRIRQTPFWCLHSSAFSWIWQSI